MGKWSEVNRSMVRPHSAGRRRQNGEELKERAGWFKRRRRCWGRSQRGDEDGVDESLERPVATAQVLPASPAWRSFNSLSRRRHCPRHAPPLGAGRSGTALPCPFPSPSPPSTAPFNGITPSAA